MKKILEILTKRKFGRPNLPTRERNSVDLQNNTRFIQDINLDTIEGENLLTVKNNTVVFSYNSDEDLKYVKFFFLHDLNSITGTESYFTLKDQSLSSGEALVGVATNDKRITLTGLENFLITKENMSVRVAGLTLIPNRDYKATFEKTNEDNLQDNTKYLSSLTLLKPIPYDVEVYIEFI